MPPINIAAKSNPATFKKALNRLASDEAFRQAATAQPETLTNEFPLSVQELHALRQVAILSGVDMKAIDKVRAEEIARGAGTAVEGDINISCCCCCCCGETAVVRAFA